MEVEFRPKRKVKITKARPVVWWEERIRIPSKPPAQHNPLPHFKGASHHGDRMANYPYPLYHTFFTRAHPPIPRKWRMIIIENKYLQVMIAPELGGRIYSMLDKKTGKQCFQSRGILGYMSGGFGGLYIARGKEINYPQAHSITNCRDREAKVLTNPDRSVTVYISELELLHRTQWYFSYTLEPEASYVKEEFRAFNRHLFPMPFQFWNNASVPAEKGSIHLYSEDKALQHGGAAQFTCRNFRGYDLVRFEEVEDTLGFYLKEANDGLVGHYDPRTGHGVARWADPERAPGKKYWTFGYQTLEQRNRRVVLSGGVADYTEIQSGYIENQDHFQILTPLEEVRFEEYWFPVGNIGEFQLSSKYGALAINPNHGHARIGFQATRPFRNDRITVVAPGRRILSRNINLAPGEWITFDVPLRSPRDIDKLRVKVTLAGKEVINFCRGESKPPALLTQYEQRGGLYTEVEAKGNPEVLTNMGRWAEKENTEPRAERIYRAVLKLDPEHAKANQYLGAILCKRGLHDEAHRCLDRSARRDPYDGETFYLMALNALKNKDLELAKRAARQAVRCHAALNGNFLLGMISLREGQPDRAADYLEKARALNANSTRTGAYLAMAYRRLHRPADAAAELQRVLHVDPTDHLAQWELARLEKASAKRRRRADLIKQLGHLHQPYLEMATDYMAVGEYQQAAQVLQTALRAIPASRPLALVHYYLGYLFDLMGKKDRARSAFAKGSKCSQEFVLPFRDETFDVLDVALKYDPKDSAAYCYLGMLLYHRRRFEKGYRMFQRAVRLNPSDWMAHRNLGLYWSRVRNQPRKAEAFYDTMLKHAPKNFFVYQEYVDLLHELKKYEKIVRFSQANWKMVSTNVALAMQHVDALLQAGRIEEAIEVSRKVRLENVSGSMSLAGLFGDGPGLRALKAYGDQLMSRGKYDQAIAVFQETLHDHHNWQEGPANARYFAEAWYKIGQAYKKKGDMERAEASFRKALEEDNRITWRGTGVESLIWINRFYQALAMKELGMTSQANAIFDGLIEFWKLIEQTRCGGYDPRFPAIVDEVRNTHKRSVDTTFGVPEAEF